MSTQAPPRPTFDPHIVVTGPAMTSQRTTSTTPTVRHTRSADGTLIAYEVSGTGPPLILVDGAGSYRDMGPARPLAGHLSADFTVVAYDRRGRGASGDTLPYAIDREVEDLAALVDELGGSAFAHGVSSGALLVLHAAAGGVALPRLSLFEPPIGDERDRAADRAFTDELALLVADGRDADAVERFLTAIGVPEDVIEQMGPVRHALEGIAHTLVYDSRLSTATPLELVASVPAPTLVVDSAGSSGDLSGWAAAVADALPNATRRSLAGQWHQVSEEDLAPVLTEFFLA